MLIMPKYILATTAASQIHGALVQRSMHFSAGTACLAMSAVPGPTAFKQVAT
jgi:hypothetical protein